MAYKTTKWLMLNGKAYRAGHVFKPGSEEHNSIRPNDVEEGRVEEISDAEAEARDIPAINLRRRGRGTPAEA